MQHQLSADYKDAEDDKGHQLQRRAKEMYKWNALVSFDKVDWSVSYQYVGKRPDVDYSTWPSQDITLSSYSLVDTAVTYYSTFGCAGRPTPTTSAGSGSTCCWRFRLASFSLSNIGMATL